MWTINNLKLQEKVEKDYDNHNVYSQILIGITHHYSFIHIFHKIHI